MTNTRCEATTKKHGTQCTNRAAEWSEANKRMLCHIHHEHGSFRLHVNANRQERMKRRPAPLAPTRFPNRISLELRADPIDTATPVLDAKPFIPLSSGMGEVPKRSKTMFRVPLDIACTCL